MSESETDWKAEAERLRKLLRDTGEGVYDVLALVEHYQDRLVEAQRRLQSVREILDDGHCEALSVDDCGLCLACRIGEAVTK